MSDIGLWVTVDSRRVLERFTSESLLTEVAARKGVALLPDAEQDRHDALIDTIKEAIEYLQSGRADDALLTLERGAFPKFKSLDEVRARYLERVRR